MRRQWNFVDDQSVVLLLDQYELAMLESYYAEDMLENAVFSLHFRALPPRRHFGVVCGLDAVLTTLEHLCFTPRMLDALHELGYREPFLRQLEQWHFTGDVYAMPEGSLVFAEEPLLQVEAPLPEAQLVESFIINQMDFQTAVASKAARITLAARGRRVIDFGLRRAHGVDAALKAARAAFIGGLGGTSNVLAGVVYGIPVTGTMAHSYVQAHATERAAFSAFLATHHASTLLIDTYDTVAAAHRVVELARDGHRASAVRLDSGDLQRLSRLVRDILDADGFDDIDILASGGLDEDRIDALLAGNAPIDAFAVGTALDVAADAPSFDMAYKLVSYAGVGRLKLSPGKETLPGRKQVFRADRDGVLLGDVVALAEEHHLGRPLLEKVMEQGRRTPAGLSTVGDARLRARLEIGQLPEALRSLGPAMPYPVFISPLLDFAGRTVAERVAWAQRTGTDGALLADY